MLKNNESLDTTELTIGVKVKLDLDRDLNTIECEALRALFNKHHLLLIEAANISAERQLAFIKVFGKPLSTAGDGRLEMFVSNAREDGYLGTYEIEWHSDASFVYSPFYAGCLYAVDVAPGSPPTRFVDTVAALKRFPVELLHRLEFRQVININEMTTPLGERLNAHGPEIVGCARQIIDKHPVTGESYLTPNPLQSDCVLGYSAANGQRLLQEVYDQLYQTEYVYEHHWKNGDLVLWDNLALQHARSNIVQTGNRTLRRMTIGGLPISDQVTPKQREIMQETLRRRQGAAAHMVGRPTSALSK